MSDSLITIKHLRAALEKVKALIGDVATAAADALTELDDTKMDKAVFSTATLTSTKWTSNTDEGSTGAGYAYSYTLPVASATVADGAECILAPQSQSVAYGCGMCSTVEVLDGVIRFYAVSLPGENITMQVRLIPGASEQEA